MERLTVADAARRLGITEAAIRQRINRDTITHERDEHGRVYVLIPRLYEDKHRITDEQSETYNLSALVETLRDEVQYLREKLDAAEERDRETRRIIAALTQRIPGLPPPEPSPNSSTEQRESPVTASEEKAKGHVPPEPETAESQPWWRRIFK